ncbi:MAG TPA: hypothetical protein VJ783_27490 [Pirellulales bacterium]|nr:hypothetical protein [Pirellulales bacterium]
MPRRFQFSLRALFVLVTAVGVWLGVQVNSARRQAAIVAAIEQVDGFVYYDWQFDQDDQETDATHPPGPTWLRKLIGDDYFQTVIAVCIYDPHLKEDLLPAVDELPALRTLVLHETQTGDALMRRISKLIHLWCLDISQTKVSDAGLVHLSRLCTLKRLAVGTWDGDRSVGDLGLKRAASTLDLEVLVVLGQGFTDDSIPVFERFKNLRELCLDHTLVTKEGEERFKRKLRIARYCGTIADLEAIDFH